MGTFVIFYGKYPKNPSMNKKTRRSRHLTRNDLSASALKRHEDQKRAGSLYLHRTWTSTSFYMGDQPRNTRMGYEGYLETTLTRNGHDAATSSGSEGEKCTNSFNCADRQRMCHFFRMCESMTTVDLESHSRCLVDFPLALTRNMLPSLRY